MSSNCFIKDKKIKSNVKLFNICREGIYICVLHKNYSSIIIRIVITELILSLRHHTIMNHPTDTSLSGSSLAWWRHLASPISPGSA